MKPISVKKLFEEVKHIQKGFQNQKGKKDVASK